MTYRLQRTPVTAGWWPDARDSLSKEVFEKEPSFTGILNQDGVRIMRVPNPIGFIHRTRDGGPSS
ncbi:hypothetical protein F9K97_03285 [Brucella anthropi]|uniref:hypothetical protein n=1 Tax=Brucella anthropi TaxID=529 RepID=UPI00124DA15F|nr:hypothetical protein [Brucella anthropi]KAB2788142.1 hypothetical protein F9K97_03285 [Brucella anthropi]